MSYLSWHVGMKVVCVDSVDFEGVLHDGQVYTVKGMSAGMGFWRMKIIEAPVVDIAEVVNPWWELFEVQGFCALRFRPVQPRATSIEVFKHLLISPKVPEPV